MPGPSPGTGSGNALARSRDHATGTGSPARPSPLQSVPDGLPDHSPVDPPPTVQPAADLGQDHVGSTPRGVVRPQPTRIVLPVGLGQVGGQAVGHAVEDAFLEIHSSPPALSPLGSIPPWVQRESGPEASGAFSLRAHLSFRDDPL